MEIGAKVGIAISQVNTRKQSRYGYNYGGYGGYYGKYRDYYVD